MPERNEYYLMEYLNGKYVLSVAHDSMFMEEYLSKDKYSFKSAFVLIIKIPTFQLT